MRPEEGAKAFDWLLHLRHEHHVVISTGALETRIENWLGLRSLRDRDESHQERHAGHRRPELDTSYVEPEGPLEARLAEIWQTVLGIEKIGRNDNFFDIGGDSLMAIQVLSHVRQVYGIEFPIDQAFDFSTIARIAEVIDRIMVEKLSAMTDDEAQLFLSEIKSPAL